MKFFIIGIKTVIAFAIFGLLQSCYVQQGTEAHASVIHEQYPEENTFDEDQYVEMVTVEENLEASTSMEALSTSLLLIYFQNKVKVTRWEDNLTHNNWTSKGQSWWSKKSGSTPAIISNNQFNQIAISYEQFI